MSPADLFAPSRGQVLLEEKAWGVPVFFFLFFSPRVNEQLPSEESKL